MKIKSLSDGEEIDMELNPADRDSDVVWRKVYIQKKNISIS